MIPILNSIEELNLFIKNQSKFINFKFGIHIDTGLNRLGIPIKDLIKTNLQNIKIEILISHLASSDELKNQYNKLQNINFIKSFNFLNL